MIVVTNRIPVARGWEERFEERFENRARLVDTMPGFVRQEVHRPRPMRFDREAMQWVADEDASAYYEVKTWWRAFDDFVRWTTSEAFAEAHRDRPPREMFAGPNVLEIHEVFIEAGPRAE
ncbi:MAG: antibiotic biosynthesis monooxygenase [Sandaracinaceae bacterium]|nr:antibiotic biosynthesis monooxygenase [Sandaracinaceae bacterium]